MEDDHFDVAMSGIALTVQRSRSFPSSPTYLLVNLSLVVRDHEKRRFLDLERLAGDRPVTIGLETDSYFGEQLRGVLPNVELVELWSESEFFEGPPRHMDALATTAEGGSVEARADGRSRNRWPSDRTLSPSERLTCSR